MKKKKVIVALLVMCLLCVNLVGTAAKTADSQPTTYIVQSSREFREAVSSAKDGDIISVMGEIDITVNIQIGSESKHLTIKRSTVNSSIIFSAGTVVDVVNTTFEGNGMISSASWVTTSATITFTECTFQNCGSSDNLSGSGSIGGAVKVQTGSCVFSDCVFSENYALSGGHIAVLGDSQVELNNCTVKDGGVVNSGGAVAINSSSAFCEIRGSEITGNCAYDFGGGVSNAGTVIVTGTKVYANSAVNGGADIATKITGNTTLTDTIEELNELFGADDILVAGWACDYDFENGIYIPDVEPAQENALLKLEYTVISTDETEPAEPSTDNTEESGGDDIGEIIETEEPGTDTEEPSERDGSDNVDNEDDENSANINYTDSSAYTDNSNQVTNMDSSITTTSTSIVTTRDTHSSTDTDNSTTADNSIRDSSTTTMTTNNYYQAAEGSNLAVQPDAGQNTNIVLDGENNQAASGESVVTEQGSTHKVLLSQQNISIDAKGVDCTFEMVDGVYSISISANQAEGADHTDSTEDAEPSLYQIIQILLLVTILICSIWKPKSKEV